MARNDMVVRLNDQLVELDMALLTATLSEMPTLELLRADVLERLVRIQKLEPAYLYNAA
jgi:hypothetical protein